MGIVPEAVIHEIRDRSDIVEIIGGYVALKKSGRGFVGLCPFHQEKTGSFHVNPDRGIYHCFGCGTTGDVFRFLMEHDHLTFPQALEQLAGRAGIP
ncbi:MAG TPA: CHC2 zinc finger domain-containing protein, partial [bacterium]|nr:CHC2 zinc finger domain-containing protein [bacterium]